MLSLAQVEDDEVLVEVVEVPGVLLVEVVGELGLRVPLSGNTLVVVHDTKGVAVKDGAEDTGRLHSLAAGSGLDVDGAGIGEGIVSARALPERDALRIGQLGVLVMESVRLKIHVSRGCELGQHDDMLEILRGESLLAADVEMSAHAGETVGVQADLVGGETDELGGVNGLSRGQRSSGADLVVVQGQEVDGTGAVAVLDGLSDHAVDGAHDEGIVAHGHGLLDLVEDHGDKGVELGGAGEGLLHLHLGDGRLDLEGGHLVEELGLGHGLVEDMRIVGLTIHQIPALVLHGLGHLAGDLLDHRAVLPFVHEDGRSGAAICAVDKNDLADVVDERTHVGVEGLAVEDGCANVNDVGEVFLQKNGIADGFLDCAVHELIYLLDFHEFILLSNSGIKFHLINFKRFNRAKN